MNRDEAKAMDCQSARIAFDDLILDPAAQGHLDSCSACSDERRMVMALRRALVVKAPEALSMRLLALAAPEPRVSRLDAALSHAVVVPTPPDLSRQLALLVPGAVPEASIRRRWVMPVYALTALVLGVFLVLAGQAYGMALQELGVTELWYALAQLPSEWLDRLYASFPQGRYVVAALVSLQRAFQWVLVGLLMWAVLELRTPRQVGVRA